MKALLCIIVLGIGISVSCSAQQVYVYQVDERTPEAVVTAMSADIDGYIVSVKPMEKWSGREIACFEATELSQLVLLQTRTRLEPDTRYSGMLLKINANKWLIRKDSALHAHMQNDIFWQTIPLFPGFKLSERIALTPASNTVSLRRTLKDEIIDQISQTELTARVNELVGFGTRNTRASNFQAVTDYVYDTLESYGLEVELDTFTTYGITASNVVATLPGIESPDTEVIICGHYDATSNNPYILAPGADDNGSGAACVLEAGRILSGYQFSSTIKFVLFAAEEQGLLGSEHYVAEAVANGDQITDVINLDMIAYGPAPDGYVVLLETSAIGIPLTNVLDANAASYTPLGVTHSLNPFGSDHVPFLDNNIPAVLVIENEWDSNPNYHRTTDTPDYLNFPFMTDIVRMSIGALIDQAELLAPAPTRTPTIPPTLTPTPLPTETPVPTILPNNSPEIQLFLNHTAFHGADTLLLTARCLNENSMPAVVDQYIALEIGNTYFFYPSWDQAPDYTELNLDPISTRDIRILQLVLPDIISPGGPYYFWAILTNPDTVIPVSDLVVVEFSFL